MLAERLTALSDINVAAAVIANVVKKNIIGIAFDISENGLCDNVITER